METPLTGRLDPVTIERLAPLIRRGGIAVLPTDTIYGFHCSAAKRNAVSRIGRMKGRRSGGFILLASSTQMAADLVSHWPGSSREILDRLWPGPFTAILPAVSSIAAVLRPRGRVALRVPRHDALAALIEKVGFPLVSTSVNRRGEAPMTHIAAIRKGFPGLEAYIGRSGPGSRAPSAIVDLTGPAPIIVRDGARRRSLLAAIGRR